MKTLLTLLLLAATLHAVVFELDIGYGIGFPEFHFKNAPIELSIYPWKYLGFATGFENSMRKKAENSKNVSKTDIVENYYNDELYFTYHADKYKEELSTQVLQFPLLLKFHSDYFYAAAGVKIGVPEQVKVKVSYSGLRTEGCYQEFAICFDDVEHLGFAKQPDSSYEESIDAKLLFMLALEGGARVKLGKHFALLLGAFADHALNKGFDRKPRDKVEWVENFEEGTALISVSDGWRKWHPWSVGAIIKISFIFGGGGG
ncbi:MAG: hypothetical protein LBH25_05060 [Fibromonadaceae bacterium]|jgi:hypothetical protein|nr:hypothetical protein [Fibromonadaceae bacterium]